MNWFYKRLEAKDAEISALKAELANTEKVIASLYLSRTKESWESGPTDSESLDDVHNWFHNKYGDTKDVSTGLRKILKGGKP